MPVRTFSRVASSHELKGDCDDARAAAPGSGLAGNVSVGAPSC